MNSCKTCSAYKPANAQQGTCRASPPIGIPQMIVNPVTNKPEMTLLSGWPPVAPDDGCRDKWEMAVERSN
jgi:hypothetical protein